MCQKTEADLREPDFRKTLAEEICFTMNSRREFGWGYLFVYVRR